MFGHQRKNKNSMAFLPFAYPLCGVRPGMERQDEEIKGELLNRILLDRRIQSTDILVTVQGGVVTLSGVVQDKRERQLAEEAAFSVPGVVDVHNELQVRTE